MEQQDAVRVYSFRVFDASTMEMSISKYKATREAIVSHLGGEVIEGTDHRVSANELDEHGRYRRIATGWGELS